MQTTASRSLARQEHPRARVNLNLLRAHGSLWTQERSWRAIGAIRDCVLLMATADLSGYIMQMRFPVAWSLAAASVLIWNSSCGTKGDGGGPGYTVRKITEPIVGGTLDSGPANDAVVMLIHQVNAVTGEAELCTGSVISPHVVLTARHCVSHNNSPTVSCGNDVGADHIPSDMFVVKGANPTQSNGQPNVISQGVQIIHPPGSSLCSNDIALLVVQQKLYMTPLKVRVNGGPNWGESFRAIGYGMTKGLIGGQPDPSDPNGPNSATLPKRYYRDGVTVHTVTEFEFLGTQSTCSGDSGGPAISQNGAVFGVTSRGIDCYGSENYWTRIDSFKSYVDQAVQSVGESYTEEDGSSVGGSGGGPAGAGGGPAGAGGGPAGAGGAPAGSGGGGPAGSGGSITGPGANCDNGKACSGNLLCVSDLGLNYCAEQCSEAKPNCSNGYECAIDQGVCFLRKSCNDSTECAPGWWCLESSGANYCGQACSATNTSCPDGFSCDVDQGACFKIAGTYFGSSSDGGCSLPNATPHPSQAGWVALALSALLARRRRSR
jgi:hypothetical protein